MKVIYRRTERITEIKYYWKYLRLKIIRESNNICSKCDKKFQTTQLELDHITPISLGGNEFKLSNLQLLCDPCHTEKTIKDINIYHKLVRYKIIEKMGEYCWYVYPPEEITNTRIDKRTTEKVFRKYLKYENIIDMDNVNNVFNVDKSH